MARRSSLNHHMNELFKADVEDGAEKVSQLRSKMHNIMEWGSGARMREIEVVMDKIYDVEQAEQAATQAKSLEGESPTKQQKRKGEHR